MVGLRAIRRGKRCVIALTLACALGPAIAFEGKAPEQPSEPSALEQSFDDLIATAKTSMMGAPSEAMTAAEASYAIASSMTGEQQTVAMATALWLKSEAAMRVGQPEEGLKAVREGLALLENVEGETVLKADLTLSLGRLAGRLSQAKLAVTSFFEAHELFVEVGNARKESLALQSLGSIYRDAKSYDKAIEFFRRAAEVYQGDDIVRLSIENNVGNILRDTDRYDEARPYFDRALAIAEEMGSDILVARVLTNMAQLELESGRYQRSHDHVDRAAKLLQTPEGKHWARFVLATDADLALIAGQDMSALASIEQALDGVALGETTMSFKEVHETAARVYAAVGEWEKAFIHQRHFKRLSDEALSIAASSNLALLGAEFQFAEQELAIQRLRNEKLESAAKLNEVEERQQTQQFIITSGSLVILLVLGVVAFVLRTQRKVAGINNELSTTVEQLSTEIERREKMEQDLIEAKEKAEDADRMKSAFLATMSHELRTPMNGILGFTEVLLGSDLSDEQREQVEIIDQSSGSLLTLINDILDLSQLEAGKFNLREGDFDPRVTAENAVKLLRAKAQEKHLDLVVSIGSDVPVKAYGDEDRLRQILLNLVGNAVKFTEKGAVFLEVTRGEAEGSLHFAVRDTGVGIPQDKIDILFDRFSQIDGELTRKQAGSGLGLAICKELTAAMGGDIGCSSIEGKGSTFYFTAKLLTDTDEAPADRPLEGQKVFILDSFNQRREAIVDMAKRTGAEPVCFRTRADAAAGLKEVMGKEDAPVAVLIGDAIEHDDTRTWIANLQVEGILDASKTIAYGLIDQRLADVAEIILEQPITDRNVRAAVLNVAGEAAPKRAATPAGSAMGSGAIATVDDTLAQKKVLVVDDVVANRKLVECILKQLGVTCAFAENGQEAIELAGTETFGIILMDVYMPVMGGIDAARTISSGHGPNANTPIFALTASASLEEQGEARKAGMRGILTKPLDVAALKKTVISCLKGEDAAGTKAAPKTA
ncbi:response regulator [Parvularcula sp. ZS-1/3]|uniref:Sensory/regulatory protein RpfC n=1 Tax=Parvularcula mediterranea TaxID=2732508 RepID=A0A7Y3W4M3_9PROT|nr:ATP-binding protein [Parvularcula mediterranea]NNU15608.1 response regulator [Parvularcula mediterranea]